MSQVAERYALALYEISLGKKTTKDVLENLNALGQCLESHEDIRTAFNSPLISNDDKVAMLKTSLAGKIPEDFTSFISLLAKNNRLSIVPGVVDAFNQLVNRDSGTEVGEVRSATELTDAEKTNLVKAIEAKLNKKVHLNYSVEKGMIGGFEAKVGSYIFEDSIKSHIQKLNEFITRRVQ